VGKGEGKVKNKERVKGNGRREDIKEEVDGVDQYMKIQKEQEEKKEGEKEKKEETKKTGSRSRKDKNKNEKKKSEEAGGSGEVKSSPHGEKKKDPNISYFIPQIIQQNREMEKQFLSGGIFSRSPQNSEIFLPPQLTWTCRGIHNAYLDCTEQSPFIAFVEERIHGLILELRKAAYAGLVL
jgi:hypothetical protein